MYAGTTFGQVDAVSVTKLAPSFDGIGNIFWYGLVGESNPDSVWNVIETSHTYGGAGVQSAMFVTGTSVAAIKAQNYSIIGNYRASVTDVWPYKVAGGLPSGDSGLFLMATGGLPEWVSADSLGGIVIPVSIANGGTNSSTALSGSSIMVSDATHVVQGVKGTTITVLHGNASGAPAYTSVLNADLGDTVSIARGGTGLKTITSHGVIYGNTVANVGVTAAGTNSQILIGNTSGAPSWSTLNALLIVLSDTTGNTGKKLTVKAGGGFDWE